MGHKARPQSPIKGPRARRQQGPGQCPALMFFSTIRSLFGILCRVLAYHNLKAVSRPESGLKAHDADLMLKLSKSGSVSYLNGRLLGNQSVIFSELHNIIDPT